MGPRRRAARPLCDNLDRYEELALALDGHRSPTPAYRFIETIELP
jgi:hypothetical protein